MQNCKESEHDKVPRLDACLNSERERAGDFEREREREREGERDRLLRECEGLERDDIFRAGDDLKSAKERLDQFFPKNFFVISTTDNTIEILTYVHFENLRDSQPHLRFTIFSVHNIPAL